MYTKDLRAASQPTPSPTSTYLLFPTTNIWTFLKLDTRNGKIWQVHYDTKGDSRIALYLNTESLVSEKEEQNGRFFLYPTNNIYTFILIDQVDGRMWQVQWSMDRDKRFLLPIY